MSRVVVPCRPLLQIRIHFFIFEGDANRWLLQLNFPPSIIIVRPLTILLVQQYLELVLLLILQSVLEPRHRFLIRQLAVHEPASELRGEIENRWNKERLKSRPTCRTFA